MCDRITCLALLGAIFITICNAAPLNSNEVEARKFVEQVSEKLYGHFNNLSHEAFTIGDKNPEAALQALGTILMTANVMVEIVNDSKTFDYMQFKDEELKYIFGILRKYADEAVIGQGQHILMLSALISFGELVTEKNIPGYQDKSMELAYFPDIQNIIAKSKDPEELKYYWTAWREKNEVWANLNFAIIIDLLEQAANLTEITPSDFWLGEYNIAEMEQVMTQIQPLYVQLHAFIRNQLHKKYGDMVIKPLAPIPDHLFQQVLAQAWSNGSVIDEMYPYRNLLPYDSILEKNNYDTLNLYRTADKFYQSLGFEPIPEGHWGTQIRMKKNEDEGDCHATVYDLTPNVYMEFCQKMDFRKFIQAHGYMGQVYYAREKANLPVYYFNSYDLEYPVGEAEILSASIPKHLNAISMVTDFKFTDEILMNRLLRMGIHTMLNIPVFFVHIKVMIDLFARTVEPGNLNKHYWMLMEKYVGVEPPADREYSDFFDFPYILYNDLNENQQARDCLIVTSRKTTRTSSTNSSNLMTL